MRSYYLIVALMASASIAAMASPQAQKPTAKTQPASSASTSAPQHPTFVFTAADKARKNPVSFTEKSVAQGKALYASQCAMCHGDSGNGKGSLATELHLHLSDFTNPASLKSYTDGELFKILSVGGGIMPGQAKRLSDKQLWDIINDLRALGGAIPSKAPHTMPKGK